MNTSLSQAAVYKKVAAAAAIAGLLLASAPAYAADEPDTTAPTVVSIYGDTTNPTSAPVTHVWVKLSEPVVGFDNSGDDVSPSSATVSNFTKECDTVYSFDMTPTNPEDGVEAKVTINEHKFTDAAGNENTGQMELARTFNSTAASTTDDSGAPTCDEDTGGGDTGGGDTGTTTDSGSGTTTPSDIMLNITSGPAEGAYINATTTEFRFTTNATTTCSINGNGFPCYDSSLAEQSVMLGNDGPAGLGDSAYTFVVMADNGSSTASTTRHFTVDTVAPVISLVSVAKDDNGMPTSLTFTSDEATGTPAVSGGCSLENTDTTGAGTSTVALAEVNDAGTYNCSFSITDPAGNQSNSLTLPEFTVEGDSGSHHHGGSTIENNGSVVVTGATVADGSGSSDLNNFPPVITDNSGGVGGNGDETSGPAVVDGSALTGEVLGAETASTTDEQTGLATTTIGAGAAAAGAGTSIPAWAWFLLALILLAALLYWAYRRSVAYDNTAR
ncbi:MAG TPA: Ig-like domain-containing protein [Candidatus Paceibacterota bacterium]|jgi:hypothetical protein|nr:Ig-like domain-containing protein [Candidatus Paceibacterota bacterium]